MLFDAPVNVYSDNHIVISDLQVNKPISKKQKKMLEKNKQIKDKKKALYQQ